MSNFTPIKLNILLAERWQSEASPRGNTVDFFSHWIFLERYLKKLKNCTGHLHKRKVCNVFKKKEKGESACFLKKELDMKVKLYKIIIHPF